MKTVKLQRLFSGKDSSLGAFFLFPETGNPTSFMIEDEYREKKIRGETRIDAGLYEIKERMALTELTKKYRKKYDFFEWHLELQDTPRHKFIYIHSGNTDDHTAGCLLPNFNALMLDRDGEENEYAGSRSRDAFTLIYKQITKWLDEGHKVYIEVLDEEL